MTAGEPAEGARHPGRPRQRTLVLGVGNPWVGDDGFGCAVIDVLLAAAPSPEQPLTQAGARRPEQSGLAQPATEAAPGQRPVEAGGGTSAAGEHVRFLRGGVAGIDLLNEFTDYDRIILIDAIRVLPHERESARSRESVKTAGGQGTEQEMGRSACWGNRPDPVPGEVVVFRPGWVELEDPDPRFSLHDLSLGGCLRLARILRMPVPVIDIVGFCIAADEGAREAAPGLSERAREAVVEAAEVTRRLLAESPRLWKDLCWAGRDERSTVVPPDAPTPGKAGSGFNR